MRKHSIIPMLNLQIFADGGAGAGAGAGGTAEGQGVTEAAALPQTKGEKNPLASVKYGIQEEAPAAKVQKTATPDRNAEFEALIKGEYKDLYDAKMQDTIQKRLKGHKELEAKHTALQPVLDILAKKHGVDASDIDALTKAIEEDDSYFEDEALEKGMTVKQLKEFKKIERENAAFKAQMEEQKRQECPDAELLLDIGHLYGAGGDPIEIIHKYADRIAAVHFKDIEMKDESIGLDKWYDRLRFCELGAGTPELVDYDACVKALCEVGYDKWILVEHDTHTDDPFKQLKISLDRLKESFAKYSK